MTNKPFDPHRPFATGDGRPRKLIAVLERPTPGGSTILVQDQNGEIWRHRADGRFYDRCTSESDLVNIPERVEVDAWAVISPFGGRVGLFYSELEAVGLVKEMEGFTIVRLTGSYER